MNKDKNLILIKGEDKTEEIQGYKSENNHVHIKFQNSDKWYNYLPADVNIYKDPIKIDLQKNDIYLKNGYIYNIVKVLKFDIYYKIFFENNNSILVGENDIEMVQNKSEMVASTNKFEYFREIANIVTVRTENGMGLLTKEYKKINFIENNTALYKYITPVAKTGNKLKNNSDELIFPFGANKSQLSAVKNAINNQISIIEGPPRNWKNSNNIEHYC